MSVERSETRTGWGKFPAVPKPHPDLALRDRPSPCRGGIRKHAHVIAEAHLVTAAIVKQPTLRSPYSWRRGIRRRLFPLAPRPKPEGMERREALHRSPRLAACAPLAKGARPAALHRGFSVPGTVASGARTDGFRSLRDRGPPCSHGLWPALVLPRPALCFGRPHLVGADGRPRASRTHGCEPWRGRRIAHGPVLRPAPRCHALRHHRLLHFKNAS